MSNVVIKVENLGKQYRLGQVGTGTLSHDLNRWWHRVRGKEDPYLKIGEANDRSVKGLSDLVWALKDINFEVKQGEVLGIIGKNGAGKSTLLKILSQVTGPTVGEIKVKGRIASLLEVGTGFHPELTGRENIFLNGAILGMTKAEIRRKFDEIVAFSGVERYIDTPVKRYSSGMYVRLAFAVAAHLEPEILIVDEVLAVGDAEFQEKCLGKMKAVSGEGRTVLFVSHDLNAVQKLCTKAILLSKGSLEKEGQTSHIINVYKEFKSKNIEKKRLIENSKIEIYTITVNNYKNYIEANIFQELEIRLGFNVNPNLINSYGEFFILFYDINDEVVLSIFQRDSGSLTKFLTINGEISIKVNLGLKPGKYRLSVGAFNQYKEFIEWVDGVFELIVIEKFLNNQVFDQRLGKFFLNVSFNYEAR